MVEIRHQIAKCVFSVCANISKVITSTKDPFCENRSHNYSIVRRFFFCVVKIRYCIMRKKLIEMIAYACRSYGGNIGEGEGAGSITPSGSSKNVFCDRDCFLWPIKITIF